MPPQRQPSTLLELSVSAVAKTIISQCQSLCIDSHDVTMPVNLEVARRVYVSCLPGTVRYLLLEEVSRQFHGPRPRFTGPNSAPMGAGVMSNYAAAMLLSPDVKDVCVLLCGPDGASPVEAALALLAREGAGLRSLELVRPAYLEIEPQLLQQALLRSVVLKHLYLRNACRNSYLNIISSTCPNLSLLDVSGSRSVTDRGVRALLLKEEVSFKEDVACPRDAHLCLDSSCGNHDCKLTQLLFRIFECPHCCKESDKAPARLPVILHRWKCETELCRSLRVLDLGKTSVTPCGALVALMKVPLLRSFGSYKHLSVALEKLDWSWTDVYQNSLVNHPIFGINFAHIRRTTEPSLALLTKYFPSLSSMRLFDPRFQPPALELLPPTLNALHIRYLHYNELWGEQFHVYLNKPQGRNLRYLTLDFSSGKGTETLYLHDLFQSCPNLIAFRGESMHVKWTQGMSHSNVIMPHLRFLKLAKLVASKAVVQALKRCPSLEVAHFFQCPDLSDEDIINATFPLSKHLKCFCVRFAPDLTVQAVSVMLGVYEKLSFIGNVSKWGIVFEDFLNIKKTAMENNWDLELTDSSHWVSSTCNTSAFTF